MFTGPGKSDKPKATQLAGDRGRPGPLFTWHTSWAPGSPEPLSPAGAPAAASEVVTAAQAGSSSVHAQTQSRGDEEAGLGVDASSWSADMQPGDGQGTERPGPR